LHASLAGQHRAACAAQLATPPCNSLQKKHKKEKKHKKDKHHRQERDGSGTPPPGAGDGGQDGSDGADSPAAVERRLREKALESLGKRGGGSP
jgi:hypothetical protein